MRILIFAIFSSSIFALCPVRALVLEEPFSVRVAPSGGDFNGYSFLFGQDTAAGASAFWSVGLGYNNSLHEAYGSAIGVNNIVSALQGVAFGSGNQVFPAAERAIAIGSGNHLFAADTFGFGRFLRLNGKNSVIIGFYNLPIQPVSSDPWNPADPLFVIGNGTGEQNRSNAIEVLRNGDVKINKRQGDIQMGIYQ